MADETNPVVAPEVAPEAPVVEAPKPAAKSTKAPKLADNERRLESGTIYTAI